MTNLVNTKNAEIPSMNRFQKFEIYADMENVNETWAKYGHYTAPMAVRDIETGTFLKHTSNKVWWQNTEFMDVLSNAYTLYPNEPIDEQINEALNTELSDLQMELLPPITSHNGRTKYWKVISKQEFKVTDLPNRGGDDTVRIGFVVRNGMGTGVALGIDLFTFRPLCRNGAVMKGKDLGSAMWKHVGKVKKMIAGFPEGMRQAVSNTKNIVKIYEKMPQITVNSEIASKMYQDLWWMGETYLPGTWNIKKPAEIIKLHKERKIKDNDNLITVKKEINLWDTFNSITEAQRTRLDQKRVSFGTIAFQQDRLHKTAIQIVNQRAKGVL